MAKSCELTLRYQVEVTEIKLQMLTPDTTTDPEEWFEEEFMTELAMDAIQEVMAEGCDNSLLDWCFGYYVSPTPSARKRVTTASLPEWETYRSHALASTIMGYYRLAGTCKVRVTCDTDD